MATKNETESRFQSLPKLPYRRIRRFYQTAYWRMRQRAVNIRLWSEFPLAKNVASVAVVGNAGYLADMNQGAVIDRHDLVIRMNLCRIRGYEAMVGRRVDVFFSNFGNARDVSRFDPAVFETRWIGSPYPIHYPQTGTDYPQEQALGITRGLVAMGGKTAYVPTVAFARTMIERLGTRPTTGLMACLFAISLLERQPLSIYFTGFSFFQGRTYYFDHIERGAYAIHAMEQERAVLRTELARCDRNQVECDPVMANAIACGA